MTKKKRCGLLLLVALAITGTQISAAQESADGLILNTGEASEGYTLFSPLHSTTTYLIDNDGRLVHSWKSGYTPGNAVYLLANGNLLRTAKLQSGTFDAGGAGGRIEEFNWAGELVWEFEYASTDYLQHHDTEKLPNGNVLIIAWERKTAEEAIAAGRNPASLPTGNTARPGKPPQAGQRNGNQTPEEEGTLWPDHVVEVDPAGNIVWEWHVWDHLVQEYDPTQDNYGVVANHPELIDINYVWGKVDSDWTHTNSIDYNANLDQILLSVHNFSEIWVIDHSTTTEEAASHNGGNSGKGGDLLYRWGNPQTYGAGAASDQQLFGQHDAKWIETGLVGADHILIFNNGDKRLRPFSSVEEIAPPLDGAGHYALTPGTAYGPEQPTWQYMAETPADFYASHISGAQRLSNGNTLICDGPSGTFFEITADGRVVWKYINPVMGQTPKGLARAVFRAERYAPDFAGLVGKDLTPEEPLESSG